MYEIKQEINNDDLIKQIPSLEIFKKYCSNFKQVNKNFVSEFRNDKNPSSSITFIKGNYLYRDFGQDLSLRPIDYVMYKYNLHYHDAIKMILSDFGLTPNMSVQNKLSIVKSLKNDQIIHSEKKTSIIQIKSRDFSEQDILYWESYGWNMMMLVLANIKSISHYWVNDNMFVVKKGELAFSYDYYVSDGIFRRKLYFPNRQNFKWVANSDETIVQGLTLAPYKAKLLVITKSLKDTGPFNRMYYDKIMSVAAVSPNSETQFIPTNWLTKARTRYDKVILYYDNDETGISYSNEFKKIYDIDSYMIPIESGCKDSTDFVKKYGFVKFVKLFKKQLKK